MVAFPASALHFHQITPPLHAQLRCSSLLRHCSSRPWPQCNCKAHTSLHYDEFFPVPNLFNPCSQLNSTLSPRVQYWAQSCLTSSSMTWMKGQSVPSASLLMTQSWDEWWIHQKAVLPFSETWTGWKAGQRGT